MTMKMETGSLSVTIILPKYKAKSNFKEDSKMEEKVEKVLNISVEPAEFPSTGEMLFTDTEEIGIKINDIFKPSFEDYEGCEIVVKLINGIAVISPKLYFNILPNDSYGHEEEERFTAFIPDAAMRNGKDIVSRRERVIAFGQPLLGRVGMTPSGKQIFEKIAVKGNNRTFVDDINIENIYKVVNIGDRTFIEVSNIDITALATLIYGEKNINGDLLRYQVIATEPVNVNYNIGMFNSMAQQPVFSKWGIYVLRLNIDHMDDQAKLLGYSFNYGGTFGANINRTVSKKAV